ncbi:serine protease, partial [Aliivibrio sifiae]
ITLNNNSSYSERMLLEYLQIDEGEIYTSDQLEAKVRALYTIDRFERIDYFYQTTSDGETELVVDVNEKSWGPNYLDFRFALEDDFYNESKYSLGFSINFTDINIIGLSENSSELRTNFELGTDKLMQAELYTPFLSNQLLFSSLKGTYSVTQTQFRPTPTLDNIDNYLPTEYSELEFEASLGIQPALWSDFRVGARYTTGDLVLNIFPDYNSNYERQGIFVQYRLDTLDNFTFPTKGFYLFSEYLYSEDTLGEISSSDMIDDSVVELTVNGRFAYTIKRHTLVVHGEYGVVENKSGGIPLEPKSLGGFLHLSGISKDSLSGENLAFASLVYRYRLMDNDFGLFQSPIYLGTSLEQGSVWNDEHFSDAPMYTAGSIFAGIDSPLGPIILAYGRTEQNHESVYLSIGATL